MTHPNLPCYTIDNYFNFMSTSVFLLVIAATITHALWNFAAKKVSGDIAVIWIGLMIAVIVFFPLLLFLPTEQFHFTEVLPYILASGILHTFYFLALSKSYKYGEISTVYPLARGLGISGTFLGAYILLQEQTSLFGFIGILLICFGVFAIGKDSLNNKKGVRFAFVVGVTISGYSIINKIAVGISHPLFYLLSYTFIYTLFLAPYVILKEKMKLKKAWKKYKKESIVIGIGAVGTSLMILFSFQLANVSYVVALREFAVIFGAILGFIFLKERLSLGKIIAILLIIVGAILLKFA